MKNIYKIKCTYCANIVEREMNFKKATCERCRKHIRLIWLDKHGKGKN